MALQREPIGNAILPLQQEGLVVAPRHIGVAIDVIVEEAEIEAILADERLARSTDR